MGNHLDLEIKSTAKGPTINLVKWLFNLMIFTFIVTVIVILFAIFMKIQQPTTVVGEIIKPIPLPNFAVLNRAYAQAQVEQEVKILLEQEEIDPLTNFINKYRNDSEQTKYVQSITEERDRRCDQIKNLYLNREKTVANLMRLQKFYHYSCPQVVEDFSASLNKTPSSGY